MTREIRKALEYMAEDPSWFQQYVDKSPYRENLIDVMYFWYSGSRRLPNAKQGLRPWIEEEIEKFEGTEINMETMADVANQMILSYDRYRKLNKINHK